MPTYEYQCDACKHRLEEFQSFTEEPLKKCPQCGKKKLRRLLGSGAAIIFKGSGFYQTDYRSDSYKTAAKADQDGAKPAAKGDQDGAKPAAKADKSATPGTDTTANGTTKQTKSSDKK
jgi:putative FmdB family regulatory protein